MGGKLIFVSNIRTHIISATSAAEIHDLHVHLTGSECISIEAGIRQVIFFHRVLELIQRLAMISQIARFAKINRISPSRAIERWYLRVRMQNRSTTRKNVRLIKSRDQRKNRRQVKRRRAASKLEWKLAHHSTVSRSVGENWRWEGSKNYSMICINAF